MVQYRFVKADMEKSEPLRFFNCENSLKFYMINCGSGLMLLIIFPDKTVMLYDCNVTEDNEKEILDELDDYICEKDSVQLDKKAKVIDIFVNSHRDVDHIRGLEKVNEKFPILSIWDSGQSGENIDNDDYQFYMRLRRKLKNNDESYLKVPNPGPKEVKSYGGANVFCLADAKEFLAEDGWAAKKQHTNALVLLIVYRNRKLLLAGDSDWKSWKEKIVPCFQSGAASFINSTILIASHHGSRTFFTGADEINEAKNQDITYTKSIKLIKPEVTLISCGDYKIYHHPNGDALKLYREHTDYQQVYTTNCFNATIIGMINDSGDYVVIPRSFRTKGVNNHSVGFDLKCYDRDVQCYVQSENKIPVGHHLSFLVMGRGKLLDIKDSFIIEWQVSNNGINVDSKHHENYYKGENERTPANRFDREVAYEGTHLLRCRIKNSKKLFDQTRIFVVKGVRS